MNLLTRIQNCTNIIEQPIVSCRNYSNINNSSLTLDANAILTQLKSIYSSSTNLDINSKFDLLTLKVREILDRNVPVIKLSRKEKKLKLKPWITRGILNSIKTRNRLYKEVCSSKFRDTDLLKFYKKFRNKLSHIKERSKRQYYEKLLLESKGDSRKTWEVIKNVIKSGKNKSTVPSQIEIDGKTLNNTHEILNSLNNHFATIGKDPHNTNVNLENVSSTLSHSQLNSFLWEEVTTSEISNIISNLDSRKASGSDEISIILLKKINKLISPILSELINQAVKNGVYPRCLKTAKVIPLHKGGSKLNPGNYRPISLLSNINKIFEKVLHLRLYSFLENHSIINDSQFGFREGYSTELAITEFNEHVIQSYDDNNATCAVLLDLSKAFDTVNREILLFKLRRYGIRGSMLELLKSYLDSRKQYVSGGDAKSDLAYVDVGVPQGSVLGPLLFIVHINDMKFSTNMNVLNFADDTLLYITFNNTRNMENTLNIELDKINNWLYNNHLKINASKTKYMLFTPDTDNWKEIPDPEIKIGQSILERVYEYKYLGLIIDTKLTWAPHIKYITSKLSKTLGILFKTRYYLNTKSLYLILHSLFLSHIRYGILCWGKCYETTGKPIEVLLNRAIRCIHFCNYRDNISKFYIEHNILQIQETFKLELGKFMFKYSKGLLPPKFNQYFTRTNTVHTHNTRHAKKNYFLPRKEKTKGQKSLQYAGVNLWSGIPDTLRDKFCVFSFSCSYKKYLLVNK